MIALAYPGTSRVRIMSRAVIDHVAADNVIRVKWTRVVARAIWNNKSAVVEALGAVQADAERGIMGAGASAVDRGDSRARREPSAKNGNQRSGGLHDRSKEIKLV